MLITWDEPKRLANFGKHGFDFADFEEAFSFDRFGVLPANPSRDGSTRQMLIGMWNDAVVVAVVIAPLGAEAVSLISVRQASKKEGQAYDRL